MDSNCRSNWRRAFIAHAYFCAIAAIVAACCTNHRLDTAKGLLQSGDFLAAREIYAGALKKSPRNFEAQYGMGMTWCAEAIYRTDLGLATPHDWYRAIYHLTVASNLGAGSEARPTLAILHFNLGASYSKSGDTEMAIRRLEQAVAYDSTLLKAWNLLGSMYHKKDDLAKAQQCYERAVRVAPAYAMAYFNLGAVAWARSDFAQAAKHFTQAASLAPENVLFARWRQRAQEQTNRK